MKHGLNAEGKENCGAAKRGRFNHQKFSPSPREERVGKSWGEGHEIIVAPALSSSGEEREKSSVGGCIKRPRRR